jgi:hypothetical protein
MNWFQKIFHRPAQQEHQCKWEKTYTYLSVQDIYASPIGDLDRSGTLTVGQECRICRKSQSKLTVYAKDGGVEKVIIR